MALSNANNGQLAPRTIAEAAWTRLYDSFPLNLVSRATGPRGFIQPASTNAADGTIQYLSEAAAQATESTFQPTINQKSDDLETYRASVRVSNELLADSRVLEFIGARLAGQIIERVARDTVVAIATALKEASRFSEYDQFDVGEVSVTAAKIEDHTGFKALSNLSNTYRSRACWVFSATGFQNWGTQEGRINLVTLGVRQEDGAYRRVIGEPMPTAESLISGGGGGGGGAGAGPGGGGIGNPGGGPEGQASSGVTLESRAKLVSKSPTTEQWHTAYLGCPVYTSTGLSATNNGLAGVWMLVADMSAYLHFDQPLSVRLDTESRIANNQTVIHAAYRAGGAFMEPTAGWAIVSPA